MEESKSGMSWIGVLFVILVIWAIFGGGFGNGWGNRGSCAYDGCNRVSNCEVEKREIIDSARTQVPGGLSLVYRHRTSGGLPRSADYQSQRRLAGHHHHH